MNTPSDDTNMTDNDAPPLLHCSGNYRVVYNVSVSDLELMRTDSDVFEGMLVRDVDEPKMTTTYFEEEWASLVIRTAIDLLPLYDELEDAYLYLGHWTNPEPNTDPIYGSQVVTLGKDMDNYGQDVTYTGWRVKVSAREVTWGLD